jgi:thioesterase domain-containing protein/aryl carrier-like protein
MVEVKNAALSIRDIRAYLKERLPEYMIPSSFVCVDALPLTPSGKLDRIALAKLKEPTIAQDHVKPRDMVEAQLLSIWEETLNKLPISVTENFFELGGHSILAVQMIARVQKLFGRRLPLATLFQHPTIAEMATLLRTQGEVVHQSSLIPLQVGPATPPFFCIHPVGGTVFRYHALARYLSQDCSFYGLQTPDLDGHGTTFTTLHDLAASHITALQAIQPHGPYFLGGWSMGGVVAFEMAVQLQQQGQEVAFLALIDSVINITHAQRAQLELTLDLSDAALAQDLMERQHIPVPDDEFYHWPQEEQLAYALEQAKLLNVVPVDADIGQARRLMRMTAANLYAFRRYIPPIYTGKITLFRAGDTIVPIDAANADTVPVERTLLRGWDRFTTEPVDSYVISGTHATLLDEPYVQALATQFKSCLKRLS